MEIYKGRGKKEYTKQLIEVLDDVFFFDDEETPRRDFMSLLPKLYKDEYEPAYNNLVVMEGEDIKAAIGLYPLKFVAAGRELKVSGIGNVAVTRDSRGKGYMIDRLNACLDIMKADGTVYSPLGGHRQRYGYFGYEPAGVSVCFSINKRNIRHVLGGEVKTSLTARELTEADTELLAKVKALYETQPFHAVRPDEAHMDILRSWRSTPYVALADGSFAGYFVLSRDGGIAEIMAAPGTDLLDLIICAMETSGRDSASFALPPYDTENCEYMAKICASCSLTHSEMINIFDFAAFIEAFLTVKAQRMKLGNGSLVMLIHGVNGDENLEIIVNGCDVSVKPTDKPADIKLEHREAIRCIASLYSEARNTLPAFAAGWFPVDFYAHSQDNV